MWTAIAIWIENSAVMGEYFLHGLKALKNPLIKEVRGRGLMIGLEFIPGKIDARNYCESLKDKGMLCKETHKNIIRFVPPLIVTKENIDYALDIIHGVIG